MKVLVTAGATREPIDAVRFLSNVSTGTTGAALADAFVAAGHDAVLLRGNEAARPKLARDREVFTTAADLGQRLRQRLSEGDIDAVIMAAAVADYRPETTLERKISSDAEELAMRLVRNEKLLPKLKMFSPRRLFVVGFKLTVEADDAERRAAVTAQFAGGGVDAIVHNDLAEIRRAPARTHPFWLYRAPDDAPRKLAGAGALALALMEIMPGGKTKR
ncbi:MAG TPA: phosphopantothenoylcysteine decarboxylase [Opitutus sp.]|nr:phosphopantothenoylcysteine decarboxylase [Opitutus sp.]